LSSPHKNEPVPRKYSADRHVSKLAIVYASKDGTLENASGLTLVDSDGNLIANDDQVYNHDSRGGASVSNDFNEPNLSKILSEIGKGNLIEDGKSFRLSPNPTQNELKTSDKGNLYRITATRVGNRSSNSILDGVQTNISKSQGLGPNKKVYSQIHFSQKTENEASINAIQTLRDAGHEVGNISYGVDLGTDDGGRNNVVGVKTIVYDAKD
jgi:hypothetical protein